MAEIAEDRVYAKPDYCQELRRLILNPPSFEETVASLIRMRGEVLNPGRFENQLRRPADIVRIVSKPIGDY